MQTKTLLLALATSLFSLASAQSAPGCLLGAVNSYPDPANISAICKSSDAPAKIAQFCPDLGERDAALKAFKDICAAQGVQVSTAIPSTTGTGSPNATGTGGSPTGTGVRPTGTGGANQTVGGGAKPSQPQGTGASAAGKVEMGAAAVVIAGLSLLL